MDGFKSAILAKMKSCQNGTFEPVHEIWIEFFVVVVLGSYESLEGLER